MLKFRQFGANEGQKRSTLRKFVLLCYGGLLPEKAPACAGGGDAAGCRGRLSFLNIGTCAVPAPRDTRIKRHLLKINYKNIVTSYAQAVIHLNNQALLS